MVAELKTNGINGNLVHAMRSDDNAKELLRRAGIDELKFAPVENVPVCLLTLTAEWAGGKAARETFNYFIKTHKATLAPLGLKRIESFEKAKPVLDRILVGSNIDVGRYRGAFQTGKEPWFLSYRIIFLFLIATDTPRSALLRQVAGVVKPASFNQLLEWANIRIQPTLPAKVTPIIPKEAPIAMAVQAEESSNPQSDGLGTLLNLLSDPSLLSEGVVVLRQQRSEIEQKITGLQGELKKTEDAIARLEILQGL